MSNKPIFHFVNRGIYKITPKIKTQPAYIMQWIGADQVINFNNKDEIVGRKIPVKYMFISDSHGHGNPIHGCDMNMQISLNNIKHIEATNLEIGKTYVVGERTLVLRGFIQNEFYVSEDQWTNNYETYHGVPIDEKKQIFRISMNDL